MAEFDLTLLDALAKDATPGPWSAETDDGDVKYPSSGAVLIYADADCDLHPIADFSCNHTCRMDYDTEANARFVAALVTAWPAIRARLSWWRRRSL